MPSDKASELISEMASYFQAINTVDGYYNTVVPEGVYFGEANFDFKSFADNQYPLVRIQANSLIIPEFSTKSCSKTHLEIIIHGWIRKPTNRETGQDSYNNSLHWAKDLRDAFRAYLNGQDGGDVDCDLLNSEFQQQIGYSTNNVEVSSSFTLSFDEKLGVQ